MNGIMGPFSVLGAGLIIAGFLALALPKSAIKLPSVAK